MYNKYGHDYMCDKCGDILMECLSCGKIFCLTCDGDRENQICPACNSDEIVTADIEDLIYDEDQESLEN